MMCRRQITATSLFLAILLIASSMPARAQLSSGTVSATSDTPQLRPAAGIAGKVWWITDDWGEPLGMTIVQGKDRYSGQLFLEKLVPAFEGGDARFQAGFFPCNNEDDADLKASDDFDEENACGESHCWITYRNCEGERAVWPHVMNLGKYEKFRQQDLARPIKIDPAWLNKELLEKNGNLLHVSDTPLPVGIHLFELKELEHQG